MTDKEKKVNNSNPQEGVLRFSDDDSMSIFKTLTLAIVNTIY